MTATKTQTDAQKEVERVAKEAAERKAAIDKADADFKDKVVEASEARKKTLEKFPDLGNVAETAWNETKPETDPEYKEVSLTFRQKLDGTVDTIKGTGNADEVGLEEFEKRVIELLNEQGQPVAGVIKKKEEDKAKAKTALSVPSIENAKLEDEKRFAKARQEAEPSKQAEDKKAAEDKRQQEAKFKGKK